MEEGGDRGACNADRTVDGCIRDVNFEGIGGSDAMGASGWRSHAKGSCSMDGPGGGSNAIDRDACARPYVSRIQGKPSASSPAHARVPPRHFVRVVRTAAFPSGRYVPLVWKGPCPGLPLPIPPRVSIRLSPPLRHAFPSQKEPSFVPSLSLSLSNHVQVIERWFCCPRGCSGPFLDPWKRSEAPFLRSRPSRIPDAKRKCQVLLTDSSAGRGASAFPRGCR